MGILNLCASTCGKGNGHPTLVRVYHAIGRGSFRRDDADIHMESSFGQGSNVEGAGVHAKIAEVGAISQINPR